MQTDAKNKTLEINLNDLRKEIAREILIMDCPAIAGELNDPWKMFLHVRNKAISIASGGQELFED